MQAGAGPAEHHAIRPLAGREGRDWNSVINPRHGRPVRSPPPRLPELARALRVGEQRRPGPLRGESVSFLVGVSMDAAPLVQSRASIHGVCACLFHRLAERCQTESSPLADRPRHPRPAAGQCHAPQSLLRGLFGLALARASFRQAFSVSFRSSAANCAARTSHFSAAPKLDRAITIGKKKIFFDIANQAHRKPKAAIANNRWRDRQGSPIMKESRS